MINEALAVLKSGGVVVFPTETAYGLAADATNVKAVKKLFAIKGRETGKSVPLIAASFAMVSQYVTLSTVLRSLARKHWPGALTVVCPIQDRVLDKRVLAKDGTIAIRVSSNPIAQALSKGLGRPITSTSANLAGQPACYSISAFRREMSGAKIQPDFILDAGSIPRRKLSTIVKEVNGEVVVLRQGSIRPSVTR